VTDAITVSAISGAVALLVALGAPELSNRRNDRERRRGERVQRTRKLVVDQASCCIQIMMEARSAVRRAGEFVSATENGAPQPSGTYPSHLLREGVDGSEIQLERQFASFRQILHDLEQLFEESAMEYGKISRQRRSERNFTRLHRFLGDMRVLQNKLEPEYQAGLQLLKVQGGLEDY
jgi:hypothetical protein